MTALIKLKIKEELCSLLLSLVYYISASDFLYSGSLPTGRAGGEVLLLTLLILLVLSNLSFSHMSKTIVLIVL